MYRDRIQCWLEAVPMCMRALTFLRDKHLAAYLVGGSVRDALLGRPAHDMDLVVERDALRLSRDLADHLGAAFVPMDLERDVGRVAWHDQDGVQYVDVASFRAPTLEGDLLARDFTVNAIAVPLVPTVGPLIDPANGRADLEHKLLRATTSQAFRDDPLRILRGLRQSGALGFGLAQGTAELARRDRLGLTDVSPERIRDELFQIAGLGDAASVLETGHGLGVWEVVFGHVGLRDDGLAYVHRLDSLLGDLGAAAGDSLAPFIDDLAAHWAAYVSAERPRGALLKLAAWLDAWIGNEEALPALKGLHLSRREMSIAQRSLEGASDSGFWSAPSPVSDLNLYRYYRAYGDAGLDGAMLHWMAAGAMDGASHTIRLCDAWFRRYDSVVDPPALVDGRDLIQHANLRPGPALGTALEMIREAQVQGLVTHREQALEYARQNASSSA